MRAKASRRLVVDASVARSSGGEDATFPASKYCRDFLIAVRQNSHFVVMSPDISAEWYRHQSNFARTWLRQMFARRKVQVIGATSRQDLRDKISQAAASEKARAAMLKDIHLLEAAIVTEKLIVALDDTVRELFALASIRVGEIKDVVWVNPIKVKEAAIVWIEDGAKSEKPRQIGNYSKR